MLGILRCCLLFFILGAAQQVWSQAYSVKWGELERKRGSLIYLLPNSTDDFYALRWSGGRTLGSYQLSHHENLKLKETVRIKPIADRSISTFEGARIIGELPVVFLSDKKAEKNHYYMQRYTANLEKDGEAIHLAEFDLERKRGKGSFDVKISKNGKFFGVVWSVPGKKDKKHLYGFRIYDNALNLIQEGEYLLPFEPNLSTIHEHYISDQGDYFLCVTEFSNPEKGGLFKKPSDYKSLHIFHITEDEGLQDFELELNGKRVVALALTSDSSDVFTITGVYGEKDANGVSGIFYRKADLSTGKTLQEGFQKFDEDFITENWSEQAVRRFQRKKDAGKGEPYLYSYQMRNAVFLDNGSIVGTMEQYYVQMRANPDMRVGQTSSAYYYYYNDIIVYRVNPEGGFDWVKKIRKYQVSVNDGGPYSSYESFLSGDKLHFVFNDDTRNYDSTGVFIDTNELYTANFGRKRNVVGIAAIDLNDGAIQRSILFNRADTKALAVPKLFSVSYKTGEMLVYSIAWRKEKMGVLRFDPPSDQDAP